MRLQGIIFYIILLIILLTSVEEASGFGLLNKGLSALKEGAQKAVNLADRGAQAAINLAKKGGQAAINLVNAVKCTMNCGWTTKRTTTRPLRITTWGSKPTTIIPDPDKPAKDCCELRRRGHTKCGDYLIEPKDGLLTPAYCDMKDDGGGWTVLMRRVAGNGPGYDSNRDQHHYDNGFGDASSSHWIGLKFWSALLEKNDQKLKICLGTFAGEKYQGFYEKFKVDGNNGYLLTFDNFKGNMINSLARHNNSKFRAPDGDTASCAQRFGAGWWYYSDSECYDALLTTKYKDEQEATKVYSGKDSDYGLSWKSVTSKTVNNVRTEVSLKYVAMKIRPRSKNSCITPGNGADGLDQYDKF